MNEKELLEKEKQAEAEISDRYKQPYNIFAEYCLDLIAEVRRLNESNEILIEKVSIYKTKNENVRELKEVVIDPLQQENQHYKKALEEIVDLGYSTIDQEIAKNALEVKSNE